MAQEIERKFLVRDIQPPPWKKLPGRVYRQGYLSADEQRSVRVRLSSDTAFLTIKGPTRNAVRDEFEYQIPLQDAEQILHLCVQPLIEKKRYVVQHGKHAWEIDEFFGENAGLVLAEIELADVDEEFEKLTWVGQEVTHDARYYNANLARHPFSSW